MLHTSQQARRTALPTSDDPNGRLTVMDIVKGACNERIYPVGRLDRNTTGVLLLTNDGDLASKLTHPKFVKKKDLPRMVRPRYKRRRYAAHSRRHRT